MVMLQGHPSSQEDCQQRLDKKNNQTQETSKSQCEVGLQASSPSSPCFELNVRAKMSNDNLTAEDLIEAKSFLVTDDTSASVIITRPDNIAEMPKRKWGWLYIL
jgi:hypothetical protein